MSIRWDTGELYSGGLNIIHFSAAEYRVHGIGWISMVFGKEKRSCFFETAAEGLLISLCSFQRFFFTKGRKRVLLYKADYKRGICFTVFSKCPANGFADKEVFRFCKVQDVFFKQGSIGSRFILFLKEKTAALQPDIIRPVPFSRKTFYGAGKKYKEIT